MTDYTLKLLTERLEKLKAELARIRNLEPIESIVIESHYHTVITDVQKSIEKLSKDEKSEKPSAIP